MANTTDVGDKEVPRSRISRRKVIVGAGAVAGTVWVAPVIDSFSSVAAAASIPGSAPQCAGETCASFTNCNGGPPCVCATTYAGGGYCADGNTACGSLSACVSGACPSGFICLVDTCCGEPVCYPIGVCDPPSLLAKQRLALARSGPTVGAR